MVEPIENQNTMSKPPKSAASANPDETVLAEVAESIRVEAVNTSDVESDSEIFNAEVVEQVSSLEIIRAELIEPKATESDVAESDVAESDVIESDVIDFKQATSTAIQSPIVASAAGAETTAPPEIVGNAALPPVLNIPALQSQDSATDESTLLSVVPMPRSENRVVNERPKSWVFRLFGMVSVFSSRVFGIASIIFLLAFAANIPIVQFLSFGYLLEVSGRLARKQKLRDAMIGLKKASVLGGIVLGTWLTLIPVRLVSGFWYEAHLIDPTSRPTQFLRVLQTVMILIAVLHIASVWMCGGKLRYFFWPIIAPFSFSIWFARRIAGASLFRRVLSVTIGLVSPALVDDICNAKPISDWFVPALCWKRIRSGQVYRKSRDSVWEFSSRLNLVYYFQLGLKGFLGSILWLLLPTSLLVTASYTEDGAAILSGLFGVVFAIPIFILLPFLQAHFATDGKLKRFLEVRVVFRNFGRAPLAHLAALLVALVLALPLFFLKIEQIPGELLWTLSVVFVMFSWPARLCVGWAYGRGVKRDHPRRWWIRYPVMLLAIPIALAFALILTLTRYVSWHGALSLFENHVFLLPAPFWI